jgi:hypothetical protein
MRRTCSPIYGRIFRHREADFYPRASRQERLRNAISPLPASVFRGYRTTLTRIFQIHSELRLVLLREVWLRGDYRATNRQSSSVRGGRGSASTGQHGALTRVSSSNPSSLHNCMHQACYSEKLSGRADQESQNALALYVTQTERQIVSSRK